ncbi:MAG: hypothetical protein KKB30_14875 [Proteobacteria bacterium]|nr:hypothetical protein [Pseudomonadota bacterium]MBU1715728.1 hypothetical protein [Pseudomonadota bacterium]
MRIIKWATISVLLISFTGCNTDKPKTNDPLPETPKEINWQPGCTSCHPYELDTFHNMECTECHHGNNLARQKEPAHHNLITKPAHPDNLQNSCGGCHPQTKNLDDAIHFTLKNEVNIIRQAFGAQATLLSLTEIPVTQGSPTDPLALVDDLLRRRCLRCHPYFAGDSFTGTSRGSGCAACHLSFNAGSLLSHRFLKTPTDRQCLSCHYGNFVGADYYGGYEHDFKWEYRTPYLANGNYPDRPFGLEYHPLTPDVHQTAGLACVDCHGGRELMGKGHSDYATGKSSTAQKISCETCHSWQPGQPMPLPNLKQKNNRLILTTKLTEKELAVPSMQHEAHLLYGKKAACMVCHAQWSFNDLGVHLLRSDMDDYGPWEDLAVQGSSEVEQILLDSFTGADRGYLPQMTDKLTGEDRAGLWYKGFEIRRWESPIIGQGPDGRFQVMRPILDLHLSFINSEEEVIFDSIKSVSPKNGLRPYTPHTVGKAGTFYRQRLQDNSTSYRKK